MLWQKANCILSCNSQSVAAVIVWKSKVSILPVFYCLTPTSSLAVLSGCISHLINFQSRILVSLYWFSSLKNLQNRYSISLYFLQKYCHRRLRTIRDTGFLCDETRIWDFWTRMISLILLSVLEMGKSFWFFFFCLASIFGHKLK